MSSVRERLSRFRTEFEKYTMSRTPYQLEHFVVRASGSRWKQWHQIMIECEAKYQAIANAEAEKRLLELDIEECELKKVLSPSCRLEEISNERLEIEIRRKKNQLLSVEGAMTGALKEVALMMEIAERDFADFFGKSEDELYLTHEAGYWRERLAVQLQVDLAVFGQIQAGNLDALLKLPPSDRDEVLVLAARKKEEWIGVLGQINQRVLSDAANAGLKRLK